MDKLQRYKGIETNMEEAVDMCYGDDVTALEARCEELEKENGRLQKENDYYNKELADAVKLVGDDVGIIVGKNAENAKLRGFLKTLAEARVIPEKGSLECHGRICCPHCGRTGRHYDSSINHEDDCFVPEIQELLKP